MRIKKDDNVIVLSGKDRGKTGKVIRAFPRTDRVIVSGVNIRKVHQRATKTNQKGQIVEQAFPLHVSNVAIADPKGGKATRIRYEGKGKDKVRVATGSSTTLK